MAKRLTNRQRLAFKIETLTESEVATVLEKVADIETSRKPAAAASNEDELVSYLAEAPENRRARQVLEWDKVRRRADIQDALPVSAAMAAGKN